MAKNKAKALALAEHEMTAKAAEARDTAPIAVLGKAAEIADQPPLFVLAIGTLALGMMMRRPELARTGVRMFAAEAVATGLKTIVKRSVDRTRPAAALESGPELGHGRGAADTTFNSFPSGHTAGAVAVTQAIAHELPAAALPAHLAAAAVGAVQLPRGKHYLSDVAAGAAIGWLGERIAGVALKAAERGWATWQSGRDEAEPIEEAEAHPS